MSGKIDFNLLGRVSAPIPTAIPSAQQVNERIQIEPGHREKVKDLYKASQQENSVQFEESLYRRAIVKNLTISKTDADQINNIAKIMGKDNIFKTDLPSEQPRARLRGGQPKKQQLPKSSEESAALPSIKSHDQQTTTNVNALYHPQIPLGYVPNIPPPIAVPAPHVAMATQASDYYSNQKYSNPSQNEEAVPDKGQKRKLSASSDDHSDLTSKRPRIGDAGNQDQQTTVTAAHQTSGYYSNQKGSNQSQAVTAIPRMQRIQASKYIKLEDHHRKEVRKLSEVGGSITQYIKSALEYKRYYNMFGRCKHLQQTISSQDAFVINGISEKKIFKVSEEDLNEEEIEEATKIIEESLKKIYPNRAVRAKGPASSVNPAAPPSNKQQTGAGNQRAFIDKNAPRSEILPPTMPPFNVPPTMPPFNTSATVRSEIPPPMPVSISNATTETNQGESNSNLGFDFQDLHDSWSFEPGESNNRNFDWT